jgi:hypothetical protein
MTWDIATARKRLNVIGGCSDDDLTTAMSAALALAENYCDRQFIYAASTEQTFYNLEQRALYLRRYPLVSITTLSPQPEVGTYQVDNNAGKIIFTGQPFYESFTVTYEAGYSTLPADLELGLWEIFDMVWATNYAADNSVQLGAVKKKTIVGVGSIEYETGGSVSGASGALINDLATRMLDPYRRITA